MRARGQTRAFKPDSTQVKLEKQVQLHQCNSNHQGETAFKKNETAVTNGYKGNTATRLQSPQVSYMKTT